jgi:two-component sensor histidine kinase
MQAGIAVGCAAGGTLLHWLLEPALAGAPFITFFPSVLVASVLGGVGAGSLALALSAAIAGYLWLEPYRAFGLTKLSAATLVIFLVMGAVVVFAAHLLQTAVVMAQEAEARARLISREMQHRIGNKLALVQAVARLSARHATTLEEFQQLFSARLRALSESQALVGPDPDLPTDLAALIRVVLRPLDEQRIDLRGPLVGVEHKDRPMLALLFHELGTNAVKHGALSTPDGRVSVCWTMTGAGAELQWREIGGPRVTAPERTGFGTSLANAAFPQDRGEVSFAYDPDGLRCTVKLRAARALGTPPAKPAGISVGPVAQLKT